MSWGVIRSKNCNFVLNLRDTEVRSEKCGDLVLDEQRGDECQLWLHDDAKRIISKKGYALDVEGFPRGKNIIAKIKHHGQNQKFAIDSEGFITHIMTGKVLDVEGDMECGAQLVIKEKGSGDCQTWEFTQCAD